jgi:hypothetical protein
MVTRVEAVVGQRDFARPPGEVLRSRAAIEKYDYW